jgi:integrase
VNRRHFQERVRRSGERRFYWCASPSLRKLGFADRRLSDDRARALVECDEINREVDRHRLNMARGVLDRARPGSLRHLIAAYKAHDDYLLLAPSTRRDYGHRLEIIALRIGDAHTRELKPRIVQALKRGLAATPSQANHVLRVFRLLCSFAVREGLMESNPARAFRQYREPPRRQLWRHDEEARFLDRCGPDLALVYLLAVYTAQRQGDLLALPWSAYDGEVIRLEQAKTGAALEIPVAARLARVLAETPRAGPLICTRTPLRVPGGRPVGPIRTAWTADHFRHCFKAAMTAAGIENRRFQDLRRTAIVRLAEAGCTVPEIASISGHGIDYCARIIETYLPKTRGLARAAITKLEDHRPRDR